jgi:hypothetical protein
MLYRCSAALLLAMFLHLLPAFADMDRSTFCSQAAPQAGLWAHSADTPSDSLPWPQSCGENDPCFAESAPIARHYPYVLHLSAIDLRRYPPEPAPEIQIPPENSAPLS